MDFWISMMAELISCQILDEPSLVSSDVTVMYSISLRGLEIIICTSIKIELTDHRDPGGSSSPPTSNQSGAQKRNDRIEMAHHLGDENTSFEGEIQEIGTKEPSPAYQTISVTRQQAVNPQSDEGDDSLANGSSLGGSGADLDKESGNEVSRNPTWHSEPLKGDVLKVKTLWFRDSL
ncbi:hypothetical protein HAX54_023711 [Datura stramonium]|uniref:Uncharacterized protein n=1 Tax=Datura stramonium TaxID=4076 RepID=A0ABS8UYZ2_DATST|nr:hypothetical protein [Datura stramonium]